MNRRGLMITAAAVGAGIIPGCTDTVDGGGDGSPSGTSEPTEQSEGSATEPSADPTESPPDSPEGSQTESPPGSPSDSPSSESKQMTARSFEVLDRGCGEGENSASVRRGQDQIEVEGTIRGSNTCYTAELDRAVYDDEADNLTVEVRSYEPDDATACAQCIVDIEYRATFDFQGGTPQEVTVRHNGEHVTT